MYNPIPKLSAKELQSAIIGMVLGDAYIGKTQGSKNARMSIDHSQKQEEYLDFCTDIVKQLPDIKINKHKRQRTLKGRDKVYTTISMNTTNHHFLTRIHNAMYKEGRKTVTRHQLNKLTPLGLALWYMDDGSACFRYRNNKTIISNRAVKICTHGFTLEENQIIQTYFWEVWGIKVKIYKEYTKHYIWIQGREANKFLDLVSPHIIPSMAYKADLRYLKPKLLLVGEGDTPIIPTRMPDIMPEIA